MELKLKRSERPLLVVAHPDDESIFFGGMLSRFRHLKWTVLCLSDGNAEGRGDDRHAEFLQACKKLGVKKALHWNYSDNFPHRFPVDLIEKRLSEIEKPTIVFTHGIVGEYGHAHHQDTCYVVHKYFSKQKIPVWSAAYNSFGTDAVNLTSKEFSLKARVLLEIYRLETFRFLNILKCSQLEAFHRVPFKIVEGLYEWILDENKKLPSSLGPYKDLKPFLNDRTYLKSSAGFFRNYFSKDA